MGRSKLSHWDRRGAVRMVDVSGKTPTVRKARAYAFVNLSSKVLRLLPKNPKGDPLEVARIAGISAAKHTATLIPLCHSVPVTHIDVEARLTRNGVELESRVATKAVTGVEMEALTAVCVAALTLYDMCKAVDKSITITDICLLEKTGGKSGTFRRTSPAKASAARSALAGEGRFHA